jgi:Tfp pilus assembly protein PilO
MNPAKPTPAKAPTPSPAPAAPPKPSRKFELNSKNFRTILLAGLALLALLFVGVLFIGLGFLSKESQHMVELKVKSETADAQLANLEQAKKQVEQYSFFKDIARTVIPNDKDQAAAIIEINNIAKEVGINIQSITFPQSTLGLTSCTTGTSTQQNEA